jgi:hypothetical protein
MSGWLRIGGGFERVYARQGETAKGAEVGRPKGWGKIADGDLWLLVLSEVVGSGGHRSPLHELNERSAQVVTLQVFRGGGFVGMFGRGVVLEAGEVAGFVADLAAGGFAGQGARAVVFGFVHADGGLGPMFGLFHVTSVLCRTAEEKGVFTLWRVGVLGWHDTRR